LGRCDVRPGYHPGEIHDREEWRSRRGHFPGIERAIGNHAIDGAVNLGVTQLRLRRFVSALRRNQLSFGGLNGILIRKTQQGLQVLLRDFVLILRLRQQYTRVFELLAWNGALVEEGLIAVEDLSLGVKCRAALTSSSAFCKVSGTSELTAVW